MFESCVLISQQEGVCHIQFNRPEVRNALDQASYSAAGAAIESANQDPATRVILISGAGDNFTSGNDLGDFANGIDTGKNSPIARFMYALLGCEKPIIGAVSGQAVGIGVTMLTHFDLVYASPDARFSLSFNKLGVCAELGSSYVLPRLVGRARAMEMILLGEEFDADQALKDGIICAVVENVFEHAQMQARKLSQYPPQSTRINKRLLRQESKDKIQQVIWEEMDDFRQCLQGPEFKEAVMAFIQKRAPDFSTFK